MTDEIETFGDESHLPEQSNTDLVAEFLSLFSNKSDLDWIHILKSAIQKEFQEIKYDDYKSARKRLRRKNLSVIAAVEQGISDATIIISDPKQYYNNSLKSVIDEKHCKDNSLRLLKQFLHSDNPIAVQCNQFVIKQTNFQMLLNAPFNDFSDTDKAIKQIDENIDKLNNNVQNVRTYVNRGIGSLEEYYTKEAIGRIFNDLEQTRYLFVDITDPSSTKKTFKERLYKHIDNTLKLESYKRRRYFDEGNKRVVQLLNESRRNDFSKIGRNHFLFDQSITIGTVFELRSDQSVHIQAADIAAGKARELFYKHGLNSVKDKFKCVIYNGRVQ